MTTFKRRAHVLSINTGSDKRWNPTREETQKIRKAVYDLVRVYGTKSVIRFKGDAEYVWPTLIADMLGDLRSEFIKFLHFEGSDVFLADLKRRLPSVIYRLKAETT